MPYYLFRLDDITPNLNAANFSACLHIFQEYGVKPLVGVVPDNRDPELATAPALPAFWETLKQLADGGVVTVAQHGWQHVYHRHARSLQIKYGLDDLTEFAGLPYDAQHEKIRRGREILAQHGLSTDWWMAPNHSYDETTLRALAANGFHYLTDGIGLFPFRRRMLVCLPVLSGTPRRIPCGLTTICLHPNTMTETDFIRLRSFLRSRPRFLTFEEATAFQSPGYAAAANTLTRIFFFTAKNVRRIVRRVLAR